MLSRVTKVLLILGVLPCGGAFASSNLIVNGDFELPVVSPKHFDHFLEIPGWTASSNRIEIQVSNGFFGGRQVVGQALGPGVQFVELDSFANGAMYQDVPTMLGEVYQLTFFYSPRNGFDGRSFPASTNVIDVYWEGDLLSSLTSNGPNVPVNQWSPYAFEVTANSASGLSRLEFAAGGTSDRRGGLIDKVSLVPGRAVPEPTSALIWAIAFSLFGLFGKPQWFCRR